FSSSSSILMTPIEVFMATTGFLAPARLGTARHKTPAASAARNRGIAFLLIGGGRKLRLALGPLGRFNDDVLLGHVLMTALTAGADDLDLVHHVHAGDHLAEDAVADAILGLGLVEEGIVLDVDEELRRGAVGFIGAGHGQGAALIGQTVGRFVLDRGPGPLLL